MTLPISITTVDYGDPLLWAVFIGWILSVVLHEFGHGIVAYWGGDYTIRERGGLTLNPLQYIDPVFSLLIPAVIFMVGGVPLPGGVTFIRRDLIRSRAWQVATSLGGPAMNFILFLLLSLPFHPKIGWINVHPGSPATEENYAIFMAAMAWLQMLAVLFNLVPVPPLDGFQVVSQFMDEQTRSKFQSMGMTLFFVYFLVLWNVPQVWVAFHNGVFHTFEGLGFDAGTISFFARSFNRALFGSE